MDRNIVASDAGGLCVSTGEQVTPLNYHAIYLRNFATKLDPTEGNNVAENAASLNTQTLGSASDPLYNYIIRVTSGDFNPPADSLNQDNDPFCSGHLRGRSGW